MTGFTTIVFICSVIISVGCDSSGNEIVSELFNTLSHTSNDKYIKYTNAAANKFKNAAKFYEQVWSIAYKMGGKSKDEVLKEVTARWNKLDQATKDYIAKGWRETFKNQCKYSR